MPRTVPRSWWCPQPGAGRPDPGRRLARRRTIATVRETELRLACERLGATHLRCWDYLDGTLAEADFHGLAGQVVQLIREFRPQVVVSFGPDGGYGHPDHVTISAAATAACRQAGDPASYPGQLASGLAPYQPDRLYHSYFPPHDVLLMDRLATWLTTRPGRSLQDLGATLEILSGPLAGVYDPRGMGKIFFAMLAGLAELEREMMIERTNDGLAQAAAEGRHGGRRPVISKDMMRIALGRRADGESVASIAKGLTYKTASGDERTVSRRALYNAFKAHDAERTESA